MPFFVVLSDFLTSAFLLDELAGAIAFSPTAMRELATARRCGEEFQQGRKATLDRGVELFHGHSIAWLGLPTKGKRALQAFVTRKKAGQYFET